MSLWIISFFLFYLFSLQNHNEFIKFLLDIETHFNTSSKSGKNQQWRKGGKLYMGASEKGEKKTKKEMNNFFMEYLQ